MGGIGAACAPGGAHSMLAATHGVINSPMTEEIFRDLAFFNGAKTMKKFLATLFAVAALSAPPAAAEQLTDVMQAAMSRCIANLPNVRAIRESHVAAGFRNDGAGDDSYLHTYDGRRLLAMTARSRRDASCAFGIKGFSTEQSIRLTTDFVRRTFGNASKRLDVVGDPDVAAVWEATRSDGQKLYLVVRPDMQVGFFYNGGLIVIIPAE